MSACALLASHAERLGVEGSLGSPRRGASGGSSPRPRTFEVDGESWLQVTDLAGSASEDHHYLVSRHDDGARVIEFGGSVHGQRPPSGSSIGVRRKSAGTYSSAVLQQGRVVLDNDESEESPRTTCGLYRPAVLDNADPLPQRRLLLRVYEGSGHESVWAAACLPVPEARDVPAIGTGVWIALEAGDPSGPIWLGRRVVG